MGNNAIGIHMHGGRSIASSSLYSKNVRVIDTEQKMKSLERSQEWFLKANEQVRLIFSQFVSYIESSDMPVKQSNIFKSHDIFQWLPRHFRPIPGSKPPFFHVFQPDKVSNCFLQASHFWGKNGAKKEPFHPWGTQGLGGDWTLTSLIKLNNKYCTSSCLKMGGPAPVQMTIDLPIHRRLC